MRRRRPAAPAARAPTVWLLAAGVLVGAVWSPPAAAQVGRPPAQSPYRDIQRGGGPVFAAGYLTGGRGKLDVGITNAITVGARYDLQLSGPLRLLFGVSYAQGERHLIDPTLDSASRKSGPVDDQVFLTEGELQFLLTGAKTWRGIAPYVAAGIGIALGGGEPAADTSDYNFGTKFLFVPGGGVRWYPVRRLHVQLDARLAFWKLKYPAQYYVPAPDGTSVLRFNEADQEWTRHPWLRVGVGWTF